MRHSRWAIRHVGAGLWVSAQRPLYAILRLIQAAVMGTDASVTVGAESDAFYYAGTQFTCFTGTKVQILTQKRVCNAAYTTTVVYICAAEWLARRPQYAMPQKAFSSEPQKAFSSEPQKAFSSEAEP